MTLNTYLVFSGQAEEAFKFYAQCLNAQILASFKHADTPAAAHVPPDWQDKIMHGSLRIGDQVLMAGDVAPERYEEPKGFSLSLQMNDTSQAERVFNELAANGRIVMPLEKTFWADRFGMVVDRFGIPWLINCDGSDGTEPVTH